MDDKRVGEGVDRRINLEILDKRRVLITQRKPLPYRLTLGYQERIALQQWVDRAWWEDPHLPPSSACRSISEGDTFFGMIIKFSDKESLLIVESFSDLRNQ